LLLPPPPRSTPFPYTTLFRSALVTASSVVMVTGPERLRYAMAALMLCAGVSVVTLDSVLTRRARTAAPKSDAAVFDALLVEGVPAPVAAAAATLADKGRVRGGYRVTAAVNGPRVRLPGTGDEPAKLEVTWEEKR